MQEQNFEKQVQDKLDELSLTPSAPVWQKVENEIRQKKKRRRVMAFWLFAVLLAGGGAFWVLHPTTNKNASIASTPSSTASSSHTSTNQPENSLSFPPSLKEAAPNTTEITPVSPLTADDKTLPSKATFRAPAQAIVGTRSVSQKQVAANPTPSDISKKKTNQAPAKNTLTQKVEKQKDEEDVALWREAELQTTVTADTQSIQEIKQETSRSEIPANTLVADSTSTQPAEEKTAKTQQEVKPAADSTQTQKPQQKAAKWSWAVQAAYGRSSLQKDIFSKKGIMPETFSSPVNNSGFPPTPTMISFSPELESGAAFQIAATAKRNMNSRFAITASMQYSFFSTKSKVGQTVVRDTIVRNVRADNLALSEFYRVSPSGPLKDYTNNYHFIELPIGIEWQVHKRIPLRLQTGASLSYLIATNALFLDRNARIYYRNAEQFAKAQVFFFSGLAYRVWKHKSAGLHIGPYLQYGVSNLQKESNNHHLLSTGIKTQFSF